jgi:hypothetical protein
MADTTLKAGLQRNFPLFSILGFEIRLNLNWLLPGLRIAWTPSEFLMAGAGPLCRVSSSRASATRRNACREYGQVGRFGDCVREHEAQRAAIEIFGIGKCAMISQVMHCVHIGTFVSKQRVFDTKNERLHFLGSRVPAMLI